jgi:DNA-binding MarR family transcriptional regulator
MTVRKLTTHRRRVEPLFPLQAPVALARRFYQITLAVVAEVQDGTELRPLEFGVLIHLHHHPDIDQNTLVERMALDRTTISAMVYRLEQMGLIQRSVNGADRRARVLRLSAEGKALHDRQLPKATAAQARILAVLSAAERRSLIEMLNRVIDANQSYVRPGAGRRKPVRKAPETAATGRHD